MHHYGSVAVIPLTTAEICVHVQKSKEEKSLTPMEDFNMRHPYLIATTGLAMTFGAGYAALHTSDVASFLWGCFAFVSMCATLNIAGKNSGE
jgi:hypothetical protein